MSNNIFDRFKSTTDNILYTIAEIEKDSYKKIEFADLLNATKSFINEQAQPKNQKEINLLENSLSEMNEMLIEIKNKG